MFLNDRRHIDSISIYYIVLTLYLLFPLQNGLKDGWSTASILESNNPDIAIINLPNGAHHSDLTQMYPDEDDTDDIIQGHEQAEVILRQWLDQIKDEAKRTTDDDYEITTDDDHKITTDDDHKITFDDDHKITFDDDR